MGSHEGMTVLAKTFVATLIAFAALIVAVAGQDPTSARNDPSPAVTPGAAVASPSPCTFFADMFPVNEASFATRHATADERKVILHWASTVSTHDREYLRWMRYDGLLVFVADPNFFAPGSYWYKAWSALNTSTVVNPFQCTILPVPTAGWSENCRRDDT